VTASIAVPPECDPGHVYHLFPVLASDRNAFQLHLKSRGVGTLVHYPIALPDQPAFASAGVRACPVATKVASEVCSLPLHPNLSSEDLDFVASAALSWRADAK
jgi:dTDP-4-amino-4,6-dideoxygalactose transaminase